MSRLFLSIAFALLSVLPVAAVWAQSFEHGLFWEVVSPKGQRSVLVGSIHVGDPVVQAQIDRAAGLVKGSQRLVLELDTAQMAKAVRLMQEPSGVPFKNELAPDLASKVSNALTVKGFGSDFIERMPTWMVVLVLSLPERVGAGMDLQLAKAAQQAKKPVLGLETADEQVDVFRKFPPELMQHLAGWLVDQQAQQQAELNAVLEAYRAENIGKLAELGFEKSVPGTLSAQQQALVLDQLINRRNERMLQRLEPHLKTGKTLVAVGALHLPGILEGLTDLGYTVQRLEQ